MKLNKIMITIIIISVGIICYLYFSIYEKYDNYYSDFNFDVDINNQNEKNENKEYSCNGYFKDNSFCQIDSDTNDCNCKYQKDNLRYVFNSPETCCNKLCSKYTNNTCVTNTPYLSHKYYCRKGNICEERNGIILNNKISSNNCGNDPLNNQILMPYTSKEECERMTDICDKYNNNERSEHINKAECLKDVNCGYCSNNTGGGKCISGTASGPVDLNTYYYCTPQSPNKTYSYTYGNHSAYLLQK